MCMASTRVHKCLAEGEKHRAVTHPVRAVNILVAMYAAWCIVCFGKNDCMMALVVLLLRMLFVTSMNQYN